MRVLFAITIFAGLSAALFTPRMSPRLQAQQPSGTTYVGTLSGCSNATFTLGRAFWVTLSGDTTFITNLHVTGVSVTGLNLPGLDISVNIPIANDGSFSADFAPLGFTSGPIVASTHLEGRFQQATLTGSFRLTVNGAECGGTFDAAEGPPPTPTPQPPPSPLSLTALLPESDGCGGGTLFITVSSDRRSLIGAQLVGLTASGRSFEGSATFDPGAVPIRENGSFNWAYFPGQSSGQEIALSGTLSSAAVRGLLTVSPSTCDPIAFVAGPTPVPGFANVGSGPSGESRTSAIWLLVAIGITVLSAGFIISRQH